MLLLVPTPRHGMSQCCLLQRCNTGGFQGAAAEDHPGPTRRCEHDRFPHVSCGCGVRPMLTNCFVHTTAESEGNVDNFAYTYVPDMKVPLVRPHAGRLLQSRPPP